MAIKIKFFHMKKLLFILMNLGFSLLMGAQTLQKNRPGEMMSTISRSNLVVFHVLVKPASILGFGGDETVFEPNELRIFSLSSVDVIQIDYKFRESGKVSVQVMTDTDKSIFQKEIPYTGVFLVDELDMTAYPAGFYQVVIRFRDASAIHDKTGKYTIHKIR